MNAIFRLCVFSLLIASTLSCREDEPIDLNDYGLLQVGLLLSIEEIPTGRVESVNTDDFMVTIYDETDAEVLSILRFADIPESIVLPVGTYYATANSNNLSSVAFESPYYFGKTDVFSVSQNASQSVIINTKLANTQVSFLFSQNVVEEFSEFTGTVTSDLTGDSLFFDTGETRSGYFTSGPLSIKVDLKYMEPDGSILEKQLTTKITNALPKTNYQLSIDAGVSNSQIQINVDDDADSVDIGLNPNILSILTTSKNAYIQALAGEWIRITSQEYSELMNGLQSVTQSGAIDSLYSNSNLTFPGTQFTFVNDIGTTVPSGNYLFAFKYSCNSNVNAFEAEVKLSESSITDQYQRVGQALPAHQAGENFFVLKGSSRRMNSNAHLALYSRSAIGYTLGNTVGRYYYASGNASNVPTLGNTTLGLVLAFQGLSSTNQY
ncbi:DUF4493 domain-containing protein [Ekhidna sp.]